STLDYKDLEPRVSLSLLVSENSTLKLNYTEMNQYLHKLSQTGNSVPTDLWVPVTDKIPPQHSKQIGLGYHREISRQKFRLSFEGYVKSMENVAIYKDGATFLQVDEPSREKFSWEDKVAIGNASAYGLEGLLEKKEGKWTGWVGYTFSRVWNEFDEIDNGRRFPAWYDRLNDISAAIMYSHSEKVLLSMNWVFSSGSPVSVPLAGFQALNHNPASDPETISIYYNRVDYGERNQYRMAPYHRMDLAIRLNKKTRWGERYWEFGGYNMYARRNPYSLKVVNQSDPDTGNLVSALKQTTLFRFVPAISYNFSF
ncbi:MAG: TonB-dependent receptor, partial [Cyclobacteriaceae bacterium]|nr:TonB-dependent receptor [Cyclobacteriaceae bacterium]